MCLKRLHNIRNTLAFQLAFWYAAVFTISSILAFAISYFMIASALRNFTDDELLEDITEYRGLYQKGGMEAINAALKDEAETEDMEKRCLRVLTPDGVVLASTDISSWKGLDSHGIALKEIDAVTRPVFKTISLPGKEQKVRLIYSKISKGVILESGMSLGDEAAFLAVFERVFSIALIVMIVIATLVGWFMSRRALQGVQEVTQTAIGIQKGELAKRVPIKSRGLEIETLALTFNQMLDHIETLIKEMSQLTDNIAHDLRSPITSIRGRAELALTSEKSKDELELMAANTIEECDRLLHMINSTLDLAEADSGALKLNLEEINLLKLLMDAVDIFEPLAEAKEIVIVANVSDGLHVKADRQGLQRIMANLLDNAIKYTTDRGRVSLSAQARNRMIEIAVTDSGIGISPEDLPKIFNRYYRSDKSRSERGIGLGLSLARAIARVHHGDITVTSVLHEGSVFTVILPDSAA